MTQILPHQVYVLQLLAQNAEILIRDFNWEYETVPESLSSMWMIAFTDWYLTGERTLPKGVAGDVSEIHTLLENASSDEFSDVWTNEGLKTERLWQEIRDKSTMALKHRKIEINPPDPDGWYTVLPKELH